MLEEGKRQGVQEGMLADAVNERRISTEFSFHCLQPVAARRQKNRVPCKGDDIEDHEIGKALDQRFDVLLQRDFLIRTRRYNADGNRDRKVLRREDGPDRRQQEDRTNPPVRQDLQGR